MISLLQNMILSALQRGLGSTFANLFGLAKRYFMGEAHPSSASNTTLYNAAKDAGYEFARAGLEGAAGALFPNASMAVSVVSTMSVEGGIRARAEDRNIPLSLLKNGLYAITGATLGPVLACPLGFVTDYVVDTTAGMLHSYSNHKKNDNINSLTANKAPEQSLRP